MREIEEAQKAEKNADGKKRKKARIA